MTITFTTWNINTDSRLERMNPRETHSLWRSKAREEMVKQGLPLSDIIHIQEAGDYINNYGEHINSALSVKDYLESEGYSVSTRPLKPSDPYSLEYITAHKINRFELLENKFFYCTKTPHEFQEIASEEERLNHNYDDYHQRTVFTTHLLDKVTGEDLWTINVHIGFSLIHRKQVSKMILEFIETLGDNPKVIVAGDFNSFDNWGGAEQMEILNNSGLLTEVTKELVLPNAELVPGNTTFFAFPFDCITDDKEIKNQVAKSMNKQEIDQIFAKDCRATGGQLDHILISKNLNQIEKAVLNVTPQFFPHPVNYTEEGIKGYILDHLDGPAFASDHQPITVTLGSIFKDIAEL